MSCLVQNMTLNTDYSAEDASFKTKLDTKLNFGQIRAAMGDFCSVYSYFTLTIVR